MILIGILKIHIIIFTIKKISKEKMIKNLSEKVYQIEIKIQDLNHEFMKYFIVKEIYLKLKT